MRALETVLWPFLKRFMSGKRIEDGLAKADELSREGYKITLAYLGGEHLAEAEDIFNVIHAHEQLLEKLRGTSHEIAVKLSAWGLFSPEWKNFFPHFEYFMERADSLGIFVWIDAEELKFRERTIELRSHLGLPNFKNVGLCIQAYAKDSSEFMKDRILPLNTAIRICKGAYKKSDRQRIIRKQSLVRRQFMKIFEMALDKRVPRIQGATHDKFLLERINQYAGISAVETAALLGRHGSWADFVYTASGPEWLDFGLRRLKEDFSNILLPFKR